MYAFLEALYKRTESDNIGSLLGDLSLLPDGGPADPAARDDWPKVVIEAKASRVKAILELRR